MLGVLPEPVRTHMDGFYKSPERGLTCWCSAATVGAVCPPTASDPCGPGCLPKVKSPDVEKEI